MLLLWIICVIYVLFFVMLSFLFSAALWSPAGKGLTSCSCLWCSIVFLSHSHLVSWVRCCTWLYRFLIFVVFLTFLFCSVSVIITHLTGSNIMSLFGLVTGTWSAVKVICHQPRNNTTNLRPVLEPIRNHLIYDIYSLPNIRTRFENLRLWDILLSMV